jgi:uncharacterized membrane protein
MSRAKPSSRYGAIDMLRGLAMLWMTAFHFSFDLQHFGYLQANFYDDPFWTLQRTAIVSLFVLCAGLGQAAAHRQGQSAARFWQRWRQIAGCALLVSLGSVYMFPNSYIYFGILHGMALLLILARLVLTRCGGAAARLWALAAVSLALPYLALQAHAQWPGLDWLNARAFNWLGLISRKPITEDYAPLFPWLGVMCVGLLCGQWLLRNPGPLERLGAVLGRAVPLRALAWLGRWSLSYYMLHQPVLLGVFSVVAWLR